MCRNTSKDGNDAMSIYTPSETDSDYIRQAKTKHWYFSLGFPLIAAAQIALLIYFNIYFNM